MFFIDLKQAIPILFLAIGVTSCSITEVFIVETDEHSFMDETNYVFESDSLTIRYSFWDEDGVLGFSVYNHMSRPVYIDWKRSSFIQNGQKLDYWQETTVSSSSAIYSSVLRSGLFGRGVNTGIVVTNGKEMKIERYTFIPPQSKYIRKQFSLNGEERIEVDFDQRMECRVKGRDKRVRLQSRSFSRADTPLEFRNYIAFTRSEGDDVEFYLDHAFHVSRAVKTRTRSIKRGLECGPEDSPIELGNNTFFQD